MTNDEGQFKYFDKFYFDVLHFLNISIDVVLKSPAESRSDFRAIMAACVSGARSTNREDWAMFSLVISLYES